MKHFLVKMKVNVPYPKEFTATVDAGEIHVAVYRAIKYTLKPALGKKRFNEIFIHVQQLAGLKNYEHRETKTGSSDEAGV